MKDHAIAAPSYRDELVDDTESLVNQGKNNIVTPNHFSPMFHFYTAWKYTLSEGIEREHLTKMV